VLFTANVIKRSVLELCTKEFKDGPTTKHIIVHYRLCSHHFHGTVTWNTKINCFGSRPSGALFRFPGGCGIHTNFHKIARTFQHTNWLTSDWLLIFALIERRKSTTCSRPASAAHISGVLPCDEDEYHDLKEIV
jgi:hypothetical protein